MAESVLRISTVGAYRQTIGGPKDCFVCGEASYGSVVVSESWHNPKDLICAECLLAKVAQLEKTVAELKFELVVQETKKNVADR